MLQRFTATPRKLISATLVGTGLCLGGAQAAFARPPDACAYLSKTVRALPPGPIFLASYPTVEAGPLQGVAFLYDNAVATIALVACGDRDAASRIGDAILIALDHDRTWHDGRLRNGYMAGPIRPEPLKLAGWWDAKQNMWVEDRYQVGSDNGNMAWAMLALLALDQPGSDRRYRSGAARIGTWITQWHSKIAPGGFTGGTFGHEPLPTAETWKSTEHNTDLAAAFFRLAQATGDKDWLQHAETARQFVQDMWIPDCSCFAVGTAPDGKTRNPYLALDAQLWPLLALPGATLRYKEAIMTAKNRLADGNGFAYSQAKEGLWTEGTAQAALLLGLSGNRADAEQLGRVVDTMQLPDGSYYAASTKELPTGFMLETDPTQPRQYFHIAHLAAVSWAALAMRRYNPFTGTNALP
jgi:hypothetical protein